MCSSSVVSCPWKRLGIMAQLEFDLVQLLECWLGCIECY